MTTLAAGTRAETPAHVDAEPHRWALSFWARGLRRLARPWLITSHVDRFCKPMAVEGREHLAGLNGPALLIANHTSHFDMLIVLSALPDRVLDRTAVVAAADRFFTNKWKGAWHALRYNVFPITRGGGRAALSYSQWLLENGWSLLIFPEGRRSRTGELLPFHPGPALLAVSQGVPIVPFHIEGASKILPAGSKRSRPAAVRLRIGPPLVLPEGTSISDATARMEAAVRELAGLPPAEVTVG